MDTVRQLGVVLLAPGWTWWHERRERRPLAASLLVLGVAFPLVVLGWALVSGRSWVALSLDRTFLAWLLAAFVLALATRAVALTIWLLGTERTRERSIAAAVAGVLVVVPLGFGIVDVAQARGDIDGVFTPTDDGVAVFDPDAGADDGDAVGEVDPADGAPTDRPATSSTTTTVDRGPRPTIEMPSTTAVTTEAPRQKPARPRSGVDPAVVADVHNILLLGGDAGPGRSGLRTDTMMILSVHRATGRASLVSLPRDMEGLLFPPGSALEARYPYGFTEKANAVYPIVSANSGLRSAYETDGDIRPGVVATAQAIGYSLDVPIHDYVLVDMVGFIDLIDAVGGVTVEVTKRLPMPGNVPGAKTEYPPFIGPGSITMDGTTALGYVRSRYADSDYQRTARQRTLLAALARQVSFTEVIGRYDEVTSAVGGTLRTSLTPDELANTLALIGGETAIVESVGLVPPLIDQRRPDFQRAAEVVGAVRVAIATGTASGY
jgi:LCP family protein required for cell wall assembly